MITIVTTPHNGARFQEVVARAIESGLQIRLVQLKFPCDEAGLPEGCENLDMLPSQDLTLNFFTGTAVLQQPVEKLFEELNPKPSCIISDICLPWTINISRKFQFPRVSFSGTSCFCLLRMFILHMSKVHENITSESEYFLLPDLPERIEITKAQLSGPLTPNMRGFNEVMVAAELESYGIIMNTYEELEPADVKDYKKARNGKVWCIGPVSLCNKDDLDKAQRGNEATIDENHCLKWLDSWGPSSVIYACLGSLCNLTSEQLEELGLGLEASKKPFIWVVRGNGQSEGLEKWNKENGFEERTKGRSLLIRCWAAQTLILSHPSVGGFLTRCGWNSTLESICAGLPMITWPLFADQFLNEKLVEQILKIAVRVGVEYPMKWGEEEKIGVLVNKKNVKQAIEKLMDGEESQGRRESQESEHPLGACLFDPLVDLIIIHVQSVSMVEFVAEDVLRFGDGLRDLFFEFALGDLFVGLSLLETGTGAFNDHWIRLDRLSGCSGGAPICYGQKRAATVVSPLLLRGTWDGLDS